MKHLHLSRFMKRLPYLILVLILLLSFHYTNAQTPPPPDGGGGPGTVNDVPINFLLYPFLALGTYIGYRFFSKPK